MTTRPSSGRILAYLGAGVGLGISTAINVMHAVRSSGEWWAPWLDGAWPVLLFLALEVLTRVRWGSGAARYAAWAGVGMVALVAGVESYWNLRSMMIVARKEVWLATLGPMGIDGLMVACAAGLLADSGSAHGLTQPGTEPVHEATRPVAGPTHEPVQPLAEATQWADPVPTQYRPSGPTQSASPQVTEPKVGVAPVSQDAIDRVLTAVGSGQPMGKAAIMVAAGLSRSTTGRALTHLVAVGRLTAIGKATQPDYVLTHEPAQSVTHEPAQPTMAAR